MIYGLIFLGHATKTASEQRREILQYANKHHFGIDKFLQYKKTLNINRFKVGDSVVFFEWNCISSEKANLNTIIKYFLKNNVCMYAVTSSYCVDGSRNFRQFLYAFNLFEDIRFNFLSGKSKNGLKKRIDSGMQVGRPKGYVRQKHVWDGKEKKILAMRARGSSVYAISKELQISTTTIRRFLTTQN